MRWLLKSARFFALRITVEPKIAGAIIPRRVFTHGVIPGLSHTQALGISSPGIDEAHLMGSCKNDVKCDLEHYVGLDVSLKLTAICIIERTGKIEREGVVASDPEAIATFIKLHAPHVVRIRLETGATSTWLWTELNKMGLPVICIDARHAKAALKMPINKSDRNDAVGIARIMQCGWYKEVRVKDLDGAPQTKPFLSAELYSSRSSGILRTRSAGSLRILGSSSAEQR